MERVKHMKLQAKFLSAVFFLGVLFTFIPNYSEAAQYFAAKYSFTDKGELTEPLMMNFKTLGKKRIAAKITASNNNNKILMLACSMGEDVFMTTLDNGDEYAMYKIKFRPQEEEDLLILSYGPHGTGKTALKGVTVIGEVGGTTITTLPVVGFTETFVFNSPLQVRNNQAVLFRDKAAQLVTIEYDKALEGYTVRGVN